jgi:hypothetical protein
VRELEEMISVNFDVFSDAELEAMPRSLAKIRETAEPSTVFLSLSISGFHGTRVKVKVFKKV